MADPVGGYIWGKKMVEKIGRMIALLPIGIFPVLYLGLGILFEYVMKIPMEFYNVPIVVVFLMALLIFLMAGSLGWFCMERRCWLLLWQ